MVQGRIKRQIVPTIFIIKVRVLNFFFIAVRKDGGLYIGPVVVIEQGDTTTDTSSYLTQHNL